MANGRAHPAVENPTCLTEGHVGALQRDPQLTQPVALIDGEMTSWYGVRAIAGLRYLADLRRNRDQLSSQRLIARGNNPKNSSGRQSANHPLKPYTGGL